MGGSRLPFFCPARMTASTYLLYLAAVSLLIVTPGPTMLMCLSNAANHGRAKALASGAGALTASSAIRALSALGRGPTPPASAPAFTVLKVVGAASLVWRGVKPSRGGGSLAPGQSAPAG